MAQSGFSPILIYGSTTTGNTPSASNLTSGANGAELALNYTDGKLFYKDNAGVVQLLASKAIAGLTLPVSVANGGTGATTVSGAQTNLQVDPSGTAVSMAIALG